LEIIQRRLELTSERLERNKEILQVSTNLQVYIARSNEILGSEGVRKRQMLCFFKA
ncbi:unnamed protein product, partial [Tenebrio molitor]